MYDPKLGRWHSLDPKANSFYGFSPYNFAVNNPLSYVDPDGRSPYYTKGGSYLGDDALGFTGNIYIATLDVYDKIVKKNIYKHDDIIKAGAEFIKNVPLSHEAESRIYTHVLSQMKEVDVEKLHNGKISINTNYRQNGKPFGYNDPSPYIRYEEVTTDEDKYKITAFEGSYHLELYNVETIQNYLGVHEYTGHGVNEYSGDKHYGSIDGWTYHNILNDTRRNPLVKLN